jgi:hypothetical protein
MTFFLGLMQVANRALPPNGPTFSGRAGDDHRSNYENRDACPVRCNGWLALQRNLRTTPVA